jgi:hypothetical protein
MEQEKMYRTKQNEEPRNERTSDPESPGLDSPLNPLGIIGEGIYGLAHNVAEGILTVLSPEEARRRREILSITNERYNEKIRQELSGDIGGRGREH